MGFFLKFKLILKDQLFFLMDNFMNNHFTLIIKIHHKLLVQVMFLKISK
jgi:hypothetical protein